MATASRVHMGRLVQEASALAGVLRGSLGPRGGQVLFTRPTGEVLLSRDGRRVLEALNVESPTARMMIACISAHCDLTGDGAKTFIILLSSLFQELEKLQGRQRYKGLCYSFKQVSQYLMTIQTDILDYIVSCHLEKHLLSICPVSDTEKRTAVELVLEAYFCGKAGINRQKFLSQLCSNFFFRVTAGKDKNDVLCLVNEHFTDLYTTVTGLPVSSSRILEGLVLHRDFAVYCPTTGDKRVLIVTEPLQSAFSDFGSELNIMVESQYEASESWITKRTELIIKHMQDNNIGIILSSAKQEAAVHYCAKQSGISIVECLSLEEISLIYRITGISPFRPSLGNIHSTITETALVSFYQPLQLGAKRLVHIGFASPCVLQLHSVVLCGPVHGVTKQHACAFRGAFRMLRQLFSAMPLMEWHELKPKTQNLSESSVEEYGILWKDIDQLKPFWSETEGCSFVSPTLIDEELECSSVQTSVRSVHLHHNVTCSELCTTEHHVVSLQAQPQKCRYSRRGFAREENELHNGHQSGHLREEERPRNGHMQLQASKDSSIVQGYGIPCNYEEDEKNIQNHSKSFIKAGSVVPVGGIFEIQLHYYLLCYAKRCQTPSISILCTLLANALLNIPKILCSTQKRDAFPQLYHEVTRGLRDHQFLPNPKSLESVSCKYQLVVSVLHCAAQLLSIDLIVGVKRLPQKVEESDSETDL